MIIMYTKNNCPYCVQAKAMLNMRGITFDEVNIEQVPSAREFLIKQGHRTLPQIYQDGKLLVEGGYQGLAKQDSNFFEKLRG
jgi:glutaredoxin 3